MAAVILIAVAKHVQISELLQFELLTALIRAWALKTTPKEVKVGVSSSTAAASKTIVDLFQTISSLHFKTHSVVVTARPNGLLKVS